MAHIVHIGNSFGVRIPKAIILQLGFTEATDLVFSITEGGLLISPEKRVREDWEQKFTPSGKRKSPSRKRKSPSFSGEFSNEFDNEEWQW